MGNINISDLRPAGADLFLDSESYLNDLTEGEMLVTGLGVKSETCVYISTAKGCFGDCVYVNAKSEFCIRHAFDIAQVAR